MILSPEDWGDNLLSKHLYAQALSKNNNVYFLHTVPHPNQKDFITRQDLTDNLHLLHLKSVVKGISKLPYAAIKLQNKSIIRKVLKAIGQPLDVVWSFDQSKFQDLRQFKAPIAIFHPVDYIEKALSYTSRIANSADLVLSVSQKILDSINTSSQKHFVNHGLDATFLEEVEPTRTPGYILPDKVNIAYVGNLQIKLMDWDALINSVALNPELNFVFIGPDKASNIGGNKKFHELDQIKALPNTHFTGALSKKELAQTLPFFDAFIISYDHNKFPVHVSNSHKIMELLSSGKVIVSNFISTYGDQDLLEMTMDNTLLPDKIKTVCQRLDHYNAPENQLKRTTFARSNTYDKQIERIEILLQA
ncbi:MAG: hypothetical protein KDD41_07910 [Flavobacteriales bacterium]|nr:hypothetical protein [Flavobacteriales bacterium]